MTGKKWQVILVSILANVTFATFEYTGPLDDLNSDFLVTEGAITGLVSATDGTASWADSSLSDFISISGTTLTDGIFTVSGGIISAGTWRGSTIEVPYGGTGATTLTDGGILLGSGTSAITALGVASNGQIPIGDGTTDPVLATITGSSSVLVTNAAGSITLSAIAGGVDHGGLTGLGDVGDHLLYLDLAGTRAMTGNLIMAGYDITRVDDIDCNDVTVTSLTDGTLTISSGDITGCTSLIVDLFTIDGEIIESSGDINLKAGDVDDYINLHSESNQIVMTWKGTDCRIASDGGNVILGSQSVGCGAITVVANSDVLLSGTGHVTSGSEGFLVDGLAIIADTISNDAALNIKPSGDNDDFLVLSTDTNVVQIGVDDDVDLLQLVANALTVNGSVTAEGANIKGLNVAGGYRGVFVGDGMTISTPLSITSGYRALSSEIYAEIGENGSAALSEGLFGYYSAVLLQDGGSGYDLGWATGMYGQVNMVAAGFYSGTLTNAAGAIVAAKFTAARPDVTNAYGLYIEQVDLGDTNWAIYDNSGVPSCLDALRLGDTTVPTDTLEVNGVSVLGDGGTTNYTAFSATGVQTMAGTARVIVGEDIDLSIPKRPVANPPAEGTEAGFPTLDFDDGTDESVYIVYHLKENYASAGAFRAHLDFFVDTAPVGDANAVWGVEYQKLSHGDNFNFSATATLTTTEAITTGTPANDKKIHETSDFTLTTTGWVPHDIILIRLYRDANNGSDTFTGDARLSHIHVDFVSDKLGLAT